ncbi:MAG: hypothetical protein MUF66_01095 [Gammaproteobacteria bacterium]|jgi:hypothetical protein|nr:hypothetical protein [Gammaproteobacteria bacterium]
MIALRLAAYALLAAAVAAAALYGFQLYILQAARADLSGVSLRTLLVEVMDLPLYAAFGALLGAVLAPFPGRGRGLAVRLLVWTAVGLAAGLAAPLVRFALGLDHVPTAAEAARGLIVDPKFLVAGGAVGLVLAWVERALEWVQTARLRRRLERAGGGPLNDVDAALKTYWRERADAYLAGREQR